MADNTERLLFQQLCLGYDFAQIFTIFALGHFADEFFKLCQGQKALAESRFLGTANFNPGTFFDGLHISARIVQAGASAGVQPGKTAIKPVNAQVTPPQIGKVHIGNLQFAARRRLQIFGDAHHIVIVKINARDGVIALWFFGLFFNGDGAAIVKLDDAVTLRVIHVITENRRAGFEFREDAVKRIAAVKDVITQDERDLVFAHKGFGNDKGLGNTAGFELFAIFDGNAETQAVAEKLFEARQVVRRRNKAKFANAALDERGQRIINHRLVVDRLELLTGDKRERIQPRPGAAGEDDAFHCKSVIFFATDEKPKFETKSTNYASFGYTLHKGRCANSTLTCLTDNYENLYRIIIVVTLGGILAVQIAILNRMPESITMEALKASGDQKNAILQRLPIVGISGNVDVNVQNTVAVKNQPFMDLDVDVQNTPLGVEVERSN
jgi:hypothetical protein